jgi:hypothetical protein
MFSLTLKDCLDNGALPDSKYSSLMLTNSVEKIAGINSDASARRKLSNSVINAKIEEIPSLKVLYSLPTHRDPRFA